MARLAFCSLGVIAGLAAPAAADLVHLKNGQVLEGKTEERDGKLLLRTAHGTATIEQTQVARVEPKRHLLDDYADQAIGVKTEDVDANFALAEWCQAKGLPAKAREHACRVVAADANHAGARALVGHMLVDGQWLPREEALKQQGLAEWKGEWLPIAEAQKRATTELETSASARRQHVVDKLVKAMAYPDTESRKSAHEALSRMALEQQIPGLKEAADKCLAYYTRVAPIQTGVSRGVAITEIRVQHAQLKRPIPSLQTNLGQAQSTPVTIQLPELSVVGVQTTVGIPVGFDD